MYPHHESSKIRRAYRNSRQVRDCRGHACLRRVMGLRCMQWRSLKERIRLWPLSDPPCHPAMSDHPQVFTRECRSGVYTMQLYNIDSHRADIAAFCTQYDLNYLIDGHPSWWLPGKTVLVEIWPRDLELIPSVTRHDAIS
jgi:hypothetical protein